MMKYLVTTALAAATLTTAAHAGEPTLTIQNFIGTVDIAPGSKIKISGEEKGTQSVKGDSVTLDGGETIKSTNCKGTYGSFKISINEKTWFGNSGGYKDLDEYPTLKITAPEDVHLVVENSVIFGTAGDIGSGDIELRSCGELTVGNVNGPLDLKISGSADFKAKDTGPVKVSISGSGDAEIGNVELLDAKVTGSGDMEVADVAGPLILSTRGSGDFSADHVRGDIVYEGSGSSDFAIDRADGKVSIEIRGSGDANIDEGNISDLFVSASGSSDVDFGGTAVNADLIARGASNIDVDTVSGKTDVSRSGAADIRVGSKTYN